MTIPTVTYSSSSEEQTSPESASSEPDSHESWTPDKHDNNPYIQFQFPSGTEVIGFQIKGKNDEWVTKFTASYSIDGIIWVPIDQIFEGNSNGHSEIIIYLKPSIPIDAAFIRLYPIDWHNHISVQAYLVQACLQVTTKTKIYTTTKERTTKVYTTPEAPTTTKVYTTTPCSTPMKNPEISYSSGDVPETDKPWSPSSDDNSPFIEVKIPPGSTFVGVITKGNPEQPQWVSNYEISYTTDGIRWVVIDKIFEGNHDSITEQTNYVVPSIPDLVAIRIIPVEWIDNEVKHTDESYEKISIIVTVLLGCKVPSTTIQVSTTETPTTPTPTPKVKTTTSIQTTTPCSTPMEYPEISYSSGDVPEKGKPWSPSSDDNSPFIEVKIPPGSTFVGVITEGNPEQPQWVSKYNISYTTDGVHWVVIDKVFEGNHDSTTEHTNYVVPLIPDAVAIRIIPVEWIDHGVTYTNESYEKISIIVTVLLDCKASSTTIIVPTTTETPTPPTPTPKVTTTSIQTTTPCSIPMENPEISYSSGDVPGPGKPWSPSSDDNSPFIEVKIPPGSTFVGVITEGNPDQPQWVSKYEISYTTDGVHWVVIDKVFEGNHDSITEQTNYVVPSIPNVVAIRIIPVEWIDNGVKHTDESYEKISIIVTVLLDCKASSTTIIVPTTTETPTPPTPTPKVTTTSIQTTTPCSIPMENPEISYSSGDVPGPGKPWSPSSDDNSPFIEVKIPPGSTFVGVITEGNPDQPQWVSKYEISYTTDGVHWVVIDKVFEGNHDSITEQTNYVVPSIPNVVAIRIIPVEWIDNGVKHTDESYEKISIIVTVLLDCKASSTTIIVPTTTETPTPPTPTPKVTTTSIQTTTPCSIPMENPEISYSSGDVPGPGKPWSPSSDDNSPFIEVKIPPGSTFVGVITEGNPDQPQWVSKYEISYTTDGVHWVVIDKVFEGNHDSITEQTNYVVPSIPNVVAIRIIPVEWIDNGVKHTDESYEKISIIVTVLLDCKASSTTIIVPTTTETPTPPTPTPKVTTTSIQTTTPCSIPMENPEISYSSGDVPGPGKPWSPSSDDK
ncbi:unnamed protein product [Lampetra planeri]